MHSFTSKTLSNTVVFHNGDFVGDVEIHLSDNSVKLPMCLLKEIVAEQTRRQRIAALEQATDDELLC